MRRLPLRARLVAGFAAAMIVVLIAAGAFVFWRVQFALDHRLDQDLTGQTSDLRAAARRQSPGAAIASLRGQAREAQLLSADGRVLASGPALAGGPRLLTAGQARRAVRSPLRTARGNLLSTKRGEHLRILAVPVRGTGRTPAAVAVTAVRLDQRDEALRELLVQLTVANLIALALASAVGYRLARAALDPVERYRAQAEQIAQGATGVRLDVPDGPSDEIGRLGSTLNAMLGAQARAAERQQQFIDDASHELRTPLSTLSAEIDLALRKPRTVDEYQDTLQRIAVDTAELVDLADALLALGALGSATPPAGDIPVAELLAKAARRATGQVGPDRDVVVEAPAVLTVHGDHELLDRALGNLVDNAARYGSGTITLSAGPLREHPGQATGLSVSDQGPGMPEAFLPHAAERFRQGAPSRSGGGVGLGLALVEAITAAHHGQLRICSAGRHHCRPTPDAGLGVVRCTHPDHGTTISILLPATRS